MWARVGVCADRAGSALGGIVLVKAARAAWFTTRWRGARTLTRVSVRCEADATSQRPGIHAAQPCSPPRDITSPGHDSLSLFRDGPATMLRCCQHFDQATSRSPHLAPDGGESSRNVAPFSRPNHRFQAHAENSTGKVLSSAEALAATRNHQPQYQVVVPSERLQIRPELTRFDPVPKTSGRFDGRGGPPC